MTLLLSEKTEAVFVLTLNRPEAGNRVTTELAEALSHEIQEADNDPDICAIVLTGAGADFCLGGDPGASVGSVDDHLAFTAAFSTLTRTMLGAGTPLIAAAGGNAHAGGFSLLACCDLAVMAPTATVALPELHGGLFPLLAMAVLQPILPRKVFFDLVYGGRHLTAEEALGFNLVNEVRSADQVLDRAIERAQMLSKVNTSALRIGRQTYDAMLRMDVPSALEHARYVLPTMIAATRQN